MLGIEDTDMGQAVEMLVEHHGGGSVRWGRHLRITLNDFTTRREDALYNDLRRVVPYDKAIIITPKDPE